MNVGIRLVQIAAAYLVIGVSMGVAMGILGDFSLSSIHSHLSLLGWASMALTGLVYITLPACGHNRLARIHFWGHNLGLPLMMGSLLLMINGIHAAEKAMAVGSTLLLISVVIFAINVYRNGRLERVNRAKA